METEFKKKLRLSNITISLLIIITLQFDYFITEELMLELLSNLGLSLLLLINIFRKINIRIYSKKSLAYIVNGLIIIVGLCCFLFLALLYWGYAFSGKETPFIWISAFFLNLLLMISVIIELKLILKNN